jgi:hypothetical protein
MPGPMSEMVKLGLLAASGSGPSIPLTADMLAPWRHVRNVPILLQKSAYRRRGRAGAFLEAIHCHPLDGAGDLRSTLLTLATLTQRTQGRLVVAGRRAWRACEGSAQSLPT